MNKVNQLVSIVILGLMVYITFMVKEIHDEVINDCPTCMIPLSQPMTGPDGKDEIDETIKDFLVLALNKAKSDLEANNDWIYER